MSNVSLNACAYCGLPTARSWWGADGAEPSYCCYGCRFAAGVAAADGVSADSRAMFTRLGLAIFCTMNVMAFTMALWSSDVYSDENSAAALALQGIFRYLSFFFAVPVFYSLGIPLLENAWDSLRRAIVNSDVLLVTGVAASFLVSAVAVLREDGPVYFEVGCMVLVLVTIGRWLEATGRARASHALDALEKLLPETVRVVLDDAETPRALREVRCGDRLRVRAGERIPCDGVLESGIAHIDEQLLTGEGTVQTREAGDRVFAGTLNLDGLLLMTVTAPPEDGALARLVRMVRQARAAKGRFEQYADRLARWFLPLVIFLAIGAAVYHGVTNGPMNGILTGLSVVLIACPCALGIATPLALWTAISHAARNGVLVLSGDVFERLARIDHMCFDKTGTLTTGTPRVERMELSTNGLPCLTWIASLVAGSTHTHARAIACFLAARNIPVQEMPQVVTLPGRGLRTDTLNGIDGPVFLGSERWMTELGMHPAPHLAPLLQEFRTTGQALVCLAHDGEIRGLFLLAEDWRAEHAEVFAALENLGIGVTILSGDPNLRLPHWEARGGLLPEDKVHFLAELRNANHVVAMVGDGINDGPALAASDVGIAMGCGADVARDAASICLLESDLRKIPWSVSLARRAVRVMKQNLVWAFAFNFVGIGLACLGQLNPVLAALAMTVSSLLVLANSLRLARAEPSGSTDSGHEMGVLPLPEAPTT